MDNYRKYFIQFIKENYPNEFDYILADTDNQYKIISLDTTFAKTSKNPIDKRLDFSSYFLALIKALDKKGESFENIRKICLQITTEFVQPKNKVQEFFKRLLPKLTTTWLGQILIKAFHKRVSVNTNADGFVANIITDKQETFGLGYGIDIIECGICKLFKKHNYSKYASILCEVDEITSGLAGLKLIRTGTIANGAKKCDFRFQRIDPKGH
ncbi:L-2-amino-thiazoline-4-carboxylic acid hydrolase [Algoriphagus persicinus]|uniref:L-2-amino-thiazoline-4-carboxylic acid hydrolase n=1 Tax=Algoriphagus persicinus TaxID=3108754 RepID=UPI002B367120|nr:L-2-amino-thiazoline-4-carboxylic acid hydrolase [Algoriphagus sp. E1-3-M2]MEB2787168.1 L-2-amino-thiazoline-4-carboxylic acid hydrolase [Algoriphagus sp. E1-3-M2]